MNFRLPGGRTASALIALTTAGALLATAWAGTATVTATVPSPATATATATPTNTAAAAASDTPDDFLRDIRTWLMTSVDDRTYKISVALPANYSESGPPSRVLYVTDANAEFGMAVETARLNAPGTIVVGIGYDDPGQGFAASGVPRTLDLTPTAIAADIPTGGAPEFLAFLRDELVPRIEQDFRADPSDRALMGHSFGGLFATYALLHGDGLFHRFVIASPSIWWDDRVILGMESEYAAANDALDARVFLSVGALEETTSGFPMTSDMTNLARTLQGRAYEGLELGAHVFEDETHLSVIGAAFSRGIRFIYAAPGTEIPGTTLPAEPASAPQITTQPQDAEVTAGGDATFAAAASGTPTPEVRWQSQLPDAGDWVDIPDAVGATYTVTGAEASATGIRYRAVFTNAAGEAATDAATLTVSPAAPPTSPADGESQGGAVAPSGPDRLSATGADSGTAVSVAAALLLAGASLALIARRRSARTS